MKKDLCGRGMVLAILLLVIGTSIVPLIGMPFTSSAMGVASVELTINNDGSGDPTDTNVDVPVYLPGSGVTPTLIINFTVTGINNSEWTAFYGDDSWEDWKNITVSGDILYPVTETTLYHVGTQGEWNCVVTPSKPAGIISLGIDWPGNGSANTSIHIVNGTYVTPFGDTFPQGTDYNLTVTVRDMDGEAVKNANVYLLWEEDDVEFNHTQGTNQAGNGLNGEYTFWITTEDQGGVSPRYITISAQWYSDFWGYAKVLMTQSPAPSNLSYIIVGPFGIDLEITNNGTMIAENVTFVIHVDGGLFGQINKTTSGTIDVPAGETVIVGTGLFLGLGPITITAKVADEEQTTTGFQFIIVSFVK